MAKSLVVRSVEKLHVNWTMFGTANWTTLSIEKCLRGRAILISRIISNLNDVGCEEEFEKTKMFTSSCSDVDRRILQ
jgi:hypothetical protein